MHDLILGEIQGIHLVNLHVECIVLLHNCFKSFIAQLFQSNNVALKFICTTLGGTVSWLPL